MRAAVRIAGHQHLAARRPVARAARRGVRRHGQPGARVGQVGRLGRGSTGHRPVGARHRSGKPTTAGSLAPCRCASPRATGQRADAATRSGGTESTVLPPARRRSPGGSGRPRPAARGGGSRRRAAPARQAIGRARWPGAGTAADRPWAPPSAARARLRHDHRTPGAAAGRDDPSRKRRSVRRPTAGAAADPAGARAAVGRLRSTRSGYSPEDRQFAAPTGNRAHRSTVIPISIHGHLCLGRYGHADSAE